MEIQNIITPPNNNATYIVSKEKDAIIIDASASVEEIVSKTKGLKVLALFLTHGHYDHIVNLENIMNHFNIKCYIHALELEKLYDPLKNCSNYFNTQKVCTLPQDEFILLNKEDNIKLGNFAIKTFQTSGHTIGSICIDIDGKLFTGDTKFVRTHGRTDLYSGSKEEIEKSLALIDKNYKGHEFFSGHTDRIGIV